MRKKDQKFIKIDEVIEKAKEEGVDFGNANPRSRLRYYAKLDLLPPAERKVFEGNQPTGAYPEHVVDLLVEIDEQIEQGKSIKEIAEEKNQEDQVKVEEEPEQTEQTQPTSQKKEKTEKSQQQAKEAQRAEVSYQAPPFTLIPTYQKEETGEAEQTEQQEPQAKKERPKVFSFLTTALKFASLALLVATFSYTLGTGVLGKRIPSGLTSSLLAQPLEETTEQTGSGGGLSPATQQLFAPTPDPYLTINVETGINAPLNLKSTTTPTLSFHQGDSEGVLTTDTLTADREYELPDQSGTVCLSTGNCFAGNRVTSPGATEGQLARFSGPNTIVGSSIEDLYEEGTMLSITEQGRVGIGISEPTGKLEVQGPIYSSPSPGEEAGILGSGDSPLRVEANEELGLYINTDGEIGVGKSDPDYQLDVEGAIQASGDICTDQGGGKCLSDMTAGGTTFIGGGGGIDGSGSSGYLARWTGSSRVGNSEIYQSGSNIGIGNTNPTSSLDVSGIITADGLDVKGTTTFNGVSYNWPTATGTAGQVLKMNSSGLTWGGVEGTTDADWFLSATTGIMHSADEANYVGIGTTSPDTALDVSGSVTMSGFKMPTNATSGYVLTAATSGTGTWQGIDSALPSGTVGATLYYDGSSWQSSDFLTNTGDTINIGTQATSSTLTVKGDSLMKGDITLEDGSPLFHIVKEGTGRSLDFSVATSGADITSNAGLTLSSSGGNINLDSSVGIGTDSPSSALEVVGTTTMSGFKMPTNATSGYVLTADANGVGTWQSITAEGVLPATSESGNTLYYDGNNWATSSVLTNTGSSIDIGTTSLGAKLDVQGDVNVTGTTTLNNIAYQWPLQAATSQILSYSNETGQLDWINATATGVGQWADLGTYLYPNEVDQSLVLGDSVTSTAPVFLSYRGDSWFNTGGNVGIGTTSPTKALTVDGDSLISGQLTVATSGLSQLVLQDGSESAEFKVDAQAGNLTINSLTGEIKTGSDVNLLNAVNATVSAATFDSGDATARSSGEYVLRASVPIYPYSMPSQTNSDTYVRVSKQFATTSSLASSTPPELNHTTREYALLINYADNIPSGQNSNWRVYRPDADTTYLSFNLSGQELSSLDEGSPRFTDFYSLPDNDWQLEVDPNNNDIRIFNILLLVYDKVE